VDALVARIRDARHGGWGEAEDAALEELATLARSGSSSGSDSRISVAPRIACDLSALVREAAGPLLPQARRASVTIDGHLRPGLEVIVDPVKLTWVLASLLGNALRYSPPDSEIRVLVAFADGRAEIRVVDHGPGIAPHVQERLFDGSGGRGLTLVLIGEIVQAHGGTISAVSDLGGGATFVLRLPANAAPLDPADDESGWALEPCT
jgi:signal transduction histidine kinase